MKLVDLNLLLYAVNADMPQHARAVAWLEDALSGDETVGLTWQVLLCFLRLSTRRSVFPRPLELESAMKIVDGWLDRSCAILVHPGEEHWRVLRQLLERSGVGGNLTSDAHLAAIAIEYKAILYSADNDFARFAPALQHRNPLA
jgi:toxin-antitoxin system PIN domain toxin